jgi:hypothetical protein
MMPIFAYPLSYRRPQLGLLQHRDDVFDQNRLRLMDTSSSPCLDSGAEKLGPKLIRIGQCRSFILRSPGGAIAPISYLDR